VIRSRFLFEGHAPYRVPEGIHAGDRRHVEVVDARNYPHTDYLGSINMTSEQHSALIGELAGIEAVRALHTPCHVPGTPARWCVVPGEHPDGDVPMCVECRKPYPCPTAEVLPS
jgi:hypothetical protein